MYCVQKEPAQCGIRKTRIAILLTMISFKSAATAFYDLPTHLGQRQTQKLTDAQIGSEKKQIFKGVYMTCE